ncbi:MAG: hypothetical protein IT258_18355, partial [Saprospiraceae bacterium]|nr:hypothetical protein [Saprospiraceae bacterium]
MVRIFLRHNDQPFIYEDLAKLEVKKVHIVTWSIGLKDLAISNDFGDLDSSKPFQPFGSQPIAGASLTIGCKELFQKQAFSMNGTFVQPVLKIKWKAQPVLGNIRYESNSNANTPNPTASLQYLKNGVFTGNGADNSF